MGGWSGSIEYPTFQTQLRRMLPLGAFNLVLVVLVLAVVVVLVCIEYPTFQTILRRRTVHALCLLWFSMHTRLCGCNFQHFGSKIERLPPPKRSTAMWITATRCTAVSNLQIVIQCSSNWSAPENVECTTHCCSVHHFYIGLDSVESALLGSRWSIHHLHILVAFDGQHFSTLGWIPFYQLGPNIVYHFVRHHCSPQEFHT